MNKPHKCWEIIDTPTLFDLSTYETPAHHRLPDNPYAWEDEPDLWDFPDSDTSADLSGAGSQKVAPDTQQWQPGDRVCSRHYPQIERGEVMSITPSGRVKVRWVSGSIAWFKPQNLKAIDPEQPEVDSQISDRRDESQSSKKRSHFDEGDRYCSNQSSDEQQTQRHLQPQELSGAELRIDAPDTINSGNGKSVTNPGFEPKQLSGANFNIAAPDTINTENGESLANPGFEPKQLSGADSQKVAPDTIRAENGESVAPCGFESKILSGARLNIDAPDIFGDDPLPLPLIFVDPSQPASQWVETYHPGSRGTQYYRYCYRQGDRIQNKHIRGGNIDNPTAVKRAAKVKDAIASGKSPQRILELIFEFS